MVWKIISSLQEGWETWHKPQLINTHTAVGVGGASHLGKASIFPCFCHTAAWPLFASIAGSVLGVLIINAAGQELPLPLCLPHHIYRMGPWAAPTVNGYVNWEIRMLPFASCEDQHLLAFLEEKHLFLRLPGLEAEHMSCSWGWEWFDTSNLDVMLGDQFLRKGGKTENCLAW